MKPYTIQAGDTLSRIAADNAIPLAQLIAANSIPDPNRIQAGQTIVIPAATTDQRELVHQEGLAINYHRFRLPAGQYMPVETAKDQIVLHFTAGLSARSAFDAWSRTPVAVATSFIVDLDGSIYQTFDPRYWAYHLGVGADDNPGWALDKRSIGIEIVNPGPLVARDNVLCWWPDGYWSKFCSTLDDKRYYIQDFRGFHFWARFTPAQLAVIPRLVWSLCGQFGIPHDVLPSASLEVEKMKSFRGICSHQNFRPDKLDIGPAFPWSILQAK